MLFAIVVAQTWSKCALLCRATCNADTGRTTANASFSPFRKLLAGAICVSACCHSDQSLDQDQSHPRLAA